MRNICNSRNGGAFSCFLRLLTQDIYFRTLILIYDYLRAVAATRNALSMQNLGIKTAIAIIALLISLSRIFIYRSQRNDTFSAGDPNEALNGRLIGWNENEAFRDVKHSPTLLRNLRRESCRSRKRRAAIFTFRR